MLQSQAGHNLKFDINQEITKAFQNVNYSQWERQKQTTTVNPTTTTTNKKPGIFFLLNS